MATNPNQYCEQPLYSKHVCELMREINSLETGAGGDANVYNFCVNDTYIYTYEGTGHIIARDILSKEESFRFEVNRPYRRSLHSVTAMAANNQSVFAIACFWDYASNQRFSLMKFNADTGEREAYVDPFESIIPRSNQISTLTMYRMDVDDSAVYVLGTSDSAYGPYPPSLFSFSADDLSLSWKVFGRDTLSAITPYPSISYNGQSAIISPYSALSVGEYIYLNAFLQPGTFPSDYQYWRNHVVARLNKDGSGVITWIFTEDQFEDACETIGYDAFSSTPFGFDYYFKHITCLGEYLVVAGLVLGSQYEPVSFLQVPDEYGGKPPEAILGVYAASANSTRAVYMFSRHVLLEYDSPYGSPYAAPQTSTISTDPVEYTQWFAYDKDGNSISLGESDGGGLNPYDNALADAPGSVVHVFILRDLQAAIERLAPKYLMNYSTRIDTLWGHLYDYQTYNWVRDDVRNLYYNAMRHVRSEKYGARVDDAVMWYDWTQVVGDGTTVRPHVYDISIGEIRECVELLKRSQKA